MLAADLARREEPFVLATVVRRDRRAPRRRETWPSLRPTGNSTAGSEEAARSRPWCAKPMRAMADGGRDSSPLADPDAERRPGVTAYPMTCHSGGTVDISIEPVLPRPRLVVFGLSPPRARSRAWGPPWVMPSKRPIRKRTRPPSGADRL
jgi:xanthine dehydrogenase accessory factor